MTPEKEGEVSKRETDLKGEDSSGGVTKLNETIASEKLSPRKKDSVKVVEVDEAEYYQLLKEIKSRQVRICLTTRTKKCYRFLPR
jgi:hypothetical protein